MINDNKKGYMVTVVTVTERIYGYSCNRNREDIWLQL